VSISVALPLLDSLNKDSLPKLPLRDSVQGINPRAVCLLTIVRLLGPLTLSKAGVVGVVAVVVVVVVVDDVVVVVERTPLVVDVVDVDGELFADVVAAFEIGVVLVGHLTDVSVIALLFKLSLAVTLFVDVVFVAIDVVVVAIDVVVVVVVCGAKSEQWQ